MRFWAHSKLRAHPTWITGLPLLLWSASTQAAQFYTEAGAGLSQFSTPAPLFGTLAPSSSDIGFATQLGLFWRATGSGPSEVHFGLQTRLSGVPAGSSYFSLLAPYSVMRVEVANLFLSAGITPFVWKRSSHSVGLDSFSAVSSSTAYFGEAGIFWQVVPVFSLGVSVSATFVSSGGSESPAPALDGIFFMRFYFKTQGDRGSQNSDGFSGWRYPRGELR